MRRNEMSFIWTDGQLIGKPKNILAGAMGANQIYGQVKTLAYLNSVRVWANSKSTTAKRILKTIDDSPITIYLVGMSGGFTCFDSDPTPAGTVYFDLDMKLSVNPKGATGAHSGFERLHPYVAFLHELGHAVQFIETPLQFKNSTKGPLSALASDIQQAAGARGTRLFPSMRYADRREWFSQGPLSGTAWAVRLEYDNMFRHERPICEESGEPLRDHYNDIQMN